MEFPGERITGSFETGTGSGVGVFVHPGDGLALPAGGVPWTLRFVRAARFFHNEHTQNHRCRVGYLGNIACICSISLV